VSQQINLFNPVFLTKKKYFSTVAMAQGLGIIAAGLISLSVYSALQVQALSQNAASSKATLEQTKTSLEKIKAIAGARQKSPALEEAIRKAEGEIAALQNVSRALSGGDVGGTEGYAQYFHAFSRQIEKGIWMTGFVIQGGGSEIGLQGRALQAELVPAYLSRLRKEPVMQGKSFSALEISLPKQEPADNGAGQEQRKARSPSYVEFTLRSQGLEKPAESTGVVQR